MNILVISSYLPFPLYSGGHVRLYNLIKELSGKHKITLISEIRLNQTQKDIKEVEKICHKVITVKRRKQWSLPNIASSVISPNSFLVIGHTNKLLKEKISQELNNYKYDLIHAETFYIVQNIPTTKLPVVVVDHNIEYQVYSRFAANSSKFLKPFLNHDINKLQNDEEYVWKNATKVIAVSESDRNTMLKAGVSALIVPNGVNTSLFGYKNIQKAIRQQEKRILFIGDFKWIQNRDALNWIIKEIWPLVIKKINLSGNVKLWIVGRNIPESIINSTTDKTIIFDEKSSSRPTQELFQEAYIILAPIRVGGGTSYKILESMSCGTPVVITSLSANSLGAKNEINALVGDTPIELTQNIYKLLHDHNFYAKIARSGRDLTEKHYTWKAISSALNNVYKSITEINM